MRALKTTDKYGDIYTCLTTRFKQSFLVYVSNCNIFYLSLAKNRNGFH